MFDPTLNLFIIISYRTTCYFADTFPYISETWLVLMLSRYVNLFMHFFGVFYICSPLLIQDKRLAETEPDYQPLTPSAR